MTYESERMLILLHELLMVVAECDATESEIGKALAGHIAFYGLTIAGDDTDKAAAYLHDVFMPEVTRALPAMADLARFGVQLEASQATKQ
jgi:hypothetical protein